MQRVDRLRGLVSVQQEIRVREGLPVRFSARHVAAGLGAVMGQYRLVKAPGAALEMIRSWHEHGRIQRDGTLDGIPAWRKAG
ncbi:hypothetical protein [Halomonas sp.]|mgnify:FL=1|uniref:hypothetical protein n=1 Tax=Halomonas sp. TaxID=1486246 RepID=UPI000C922441|nr:hypothetical protein [Halomonas sp.]MAR70749.1 hypothetical protein [Halomonas sp.]|tara:strand:+ start:6590 stop:6835 length:246 start_codon:yes stop_codon:yes gene_type:complete